MEGDVPVIGRPDERLRLLDEEMWQADLRSRSVVVPSMKLSAEQQRLHDEKLTPLKLIKDTAQRRHMVCERYAELLRLALVQNWFVELVSWLFPSATTLTLHSILGQIHNWKKRRRKRWPSSESCAKELWLIGWMREWLTMGNESLLLLFLLRCQSNFLGSFASLNSSQGNGPLA